MPADKLIHRTNQEIETLSDQEIETLLQRLGPEGLYVLSDKLIKAADDDIRKGFEKNLLDGFCNF